MTKKETLCRDMVMAMKAIKPELDVERTVKLFMRCRTTDEVMRAHRAMMR